MRPFARTRCQLVIAIDGSVAAQSVAVEMTTRACVGDSPIGPWRFVRYSFPVR